MTLLAQMVSKVKAITAAASTVMPIVISVSIAMGIAENTVKINDNVGHRQGLNNLYKNDLTCPAAVIILRVFDVCCQAKL